MSVIARLRALGSIDGIIGSYRERDEYFDAIDDILESYNPKGYSVKVVDSKFEDLGRWSNYSTKVYEVTEGEEVAYFELGQEEPATESQEGMDCSFHFHEVVRKQVVAYKYVAK